MLTALTVKNFKIFNESGVTIEPGRITLFIGPNGSGKSSVLQALGLLKQSRRAQALQLNGPLLDFGRYENVVHGQDGRRRLEIATSASYQGFSVSGELSPPLPSSGIFSYRGTFDAGSVWRAEGSVGGPGATIQSMWTSGRGEVIPHNLVVADAASLELAAAPDIGIPFGIASHTHQRQPEGEDSEVQLVRLFRTVDELLEKTYLIPAIRGFGKRSYPTLDPGDSGHPLGAGGGDEEARRAVNAIAYHSGLRPKVARRLGEVLERTDLGLDLTLASSQDVSVDVTSTAQHVNLFDEAFGLNQLVEPFLWLSKATPGFVVGIEEPEIHLHPRAQASLCDVLLDIATKENKQLLLTTHSEHILMGFLTAVARGELGADELAVYEFRREGNSAAADRLRVTENGQIESGLRGFLEADIEEIGDFLAARFRKKAQ